MTRPHALVQRQPQSFAWQLEQRAFWWKFSTDRIELLADQLQREARRADAHRALARQLLDAPDDPARMTAVHESRVSRRVERDAELSRLDRLDGLGSRP